MSPWVFIPEGHAFLTFSVDEDADDNPNIVRGEE